MTKEGMGDEAMKKSLFYRAKKMPPSAQIMLLFAVEGVFLQYITSINGFGLNLYATNMGATDSQIGIIQMVPNIVACAALLPLGILADHLKSTKTYGSVFCIAGIYCGCTCHLQCAVAGDVRCCGFAATAK